MALVDGGVYINNPALLAFIEASSLANRAGRRVALVSLGTGTRNAASPRTFEEVRGADWFKTALMVMEAAMTGGGEIADAMLGRILSGDDGGRYWRIQTQVGQCDFGMDNSSPANLDCLRTLALQVVAEHDKQLDEITEVLAGR
jgi:hypothetical protein